MDDGKLSRICILKKDKGLITITLKVSKSLLAGAEFKLYKSKDEKYYAAWKMACKDEDTVEFVLKKRPEDINRHILTWQILLCSMDPKVFEGFTEVNVLQERLPCKINIPTRREMDNIPPCKINKSDKFTESLMFIIRADS